MNQKTINLCKQHLSAYEQATKDLTFEKRGMAKSEVLLIYSVVLDERVDLVIKSGRARGFSTLALAKSLPKKKIVSIDFDKHSEDVKYSEKLLKKHKNVSLVYGDSREIIPRSIKKDCVVVIDGPKGDEALLLAAEVLEFSQVKAVFIHDLTKDVFERSIAEKLFPSIEFADDKEFIKEFGQLDPAKYRGRSQIAYVKNKRGAVDKKILKNYKHYYANNQKTIRKMAKNIIVNNGWAYSLYVKIQSLLK